MARGDAIIVDSWLVIGWEVKRGIPDRRCFDSKHDAERFIREFTDPERWFPIHGPERVSRSVVEP